MILTGGHNARRAFLFVKGITLRIKVSKEISDPIDELLPGDDNGSDNNNTDNSTND